MGPGAHGHAVTVQNLGDVVGMGAFDGEGEDRPLPWRAADFGQPVGAIQA